MKGCLPLSLVISFGISIIFLRYSVRRGARWVFLPPVILEGHVVPESSISPILLRLTHSTS